tara:strand:+ start:126 stop:1982 length:1857 start_codon:yes stop_codon:yes gene_type:complete
MKPIYRPEIDGLRAIAVVAVIFYHAQITVFDHQPFQGGFIGVDIFFVISGYLITSIIFKELVSTGTFSFKYFYQRRIRRILPALLTVMVVSLPFAWKYMIPSGFLDFLKSILYSLGFSSNFYFHSSRQLYGAESGLLKPFLHTWSLSVEEQFYILFPVVLLIVFRYLRKYLIHILILGFIISLGLADWGSRKYPSFNFYVLPTRGWELLAGSILAYFEITNGKRSENKTLNLILPTIGLLLIGHSILFFNDRMFHPSFYTLSPIIGVCLIIWFSNKDELFTKILSTKLFVGIGLISYSLYLWHYPIFAFGRITDFTQGSSLNILLLGIIIIILSTLSYYFIEKPARNKKYKFKNIFSIVILIYLILFSHTYFVLNNKSLLFDKNLLEFNELENTRNSWEECVIKEIVGDNYCKIGNYENKVFLIGDSHLIPLLNDLGKKLNKRNYELNNLTQPSLIYRRKLRDDKRVNFLKNINNSIFIFGGYYQREDQDELNLIYDYYKEDFELFLKNNNKIIFLTPIPKVVFLPNRDLYLIKKNKKIDISIKKKDTIKINKNAVDFINQFNDISILDLNNIFCDEVKCYAVKSNKVILKSDLDHPSLKGAEMINDLIIKEIENKDM